MAPRSVRWRSGRSRAPPAEVEAAAEPLEDRRRAQEPDPGGGELDREREAAEALADRPDRGRARRRSSDEVRAMRAGAIHEQGDAGRRRRAAGPGARARRAMRSSSRLVTSDPDARGAPRTRRGHDRRPPSGRSCSRLSSTSSAVRSRRWARSASSTARSGDSRTPSVAAIAGSSERRIADARRGRRTRRRAGTVADVPGDRRARGASCRSRRARSGSRSGSSTRSSPERARSRPRGRRAS